MVGDGGGKDSTTTGTAYATMSRYPNLEVGLISCAAVAVTG
jgi:hypothetical protein